MCKQVAYFVGLKHSDDCRKAGLFLGVSKDKNYYTGDYLEAILRKINESMFAHNVAMYADSLDAYNLMILDSSLSLEQARVLATRQGDAWLASDDGVKLTTYVKWSRPVVRWNDILANPSFQSTLAKYKNLYVDKAELIRLRKIEQSSREKLEQGKLTFTEAMNRTVADRISAVRDKIDQADFDAERIVGLIRNYLTEEAVGEEVIAQMFPFEYEAYPGDRNSVVSWVHQNYLPHDILCWVNIKLKPLTKSLTIQPKGTDSDRANTFGVFARDAYPFSAETQPQFSGLDISHLQVVLGKYAKEINGKLSYYEKLLFAAQLVTPEKLPPAQQRELIEAVQFLGALDRDSEHKHPIDTIQANKLL